VVADAHCRVRTGSDDEAVTAQTAENRRTAARFLSEPLSGSLSGFLFSVTSAPDCLENRDEAVREASVGR